MEKFIQIIDYLSLILLSNKAEKIFELQKIKDFFTLCASYKKESFREMGVF